LVRDSEVASGDEVNGLQRSCAVAGPFVQTAGSSTAATKAQRTTVALRADVRFDGKE
jgi:hypothetical protein